MTRVPDHSLKPDRAILALQDHIDAGLIVRSFHSNGERHSQVVDLSRLGCQKGTRDRDRLCAEAVAQSVLNAARSEAG